MNKKDSVKLINTIKDYRPYPSEGKEVRVLAHYLPDAMEHDDVYENGTYPYCFEFFTERQVNDVIYNRTEAFGLFCFSFVSYLPLDDDEIDEIKEYFSNKQYAWVTLKDPSDVNDNDIHHIEGLATIACPAQPKAYDECKFPSLMRIAMCWGESGSIRDAESIDRFFSTLSSRSFPYTDGNIDALEDTERKLFSEGTDYTIKIFKVGFANSIFVKYKSGESLLIDCGIDNTYVQKGVMNAQNYIKQKVKPTNILISHWHEDHYNMLGNLDVTNLKCVITPDSGTMNDNTRLLLETWSNSVNIISFTKTKPSNFLESLFPGLKLHIGKGLTPSATEQNQKCVGIVTRPQNETQLNNEGIIVTISHKNRTVIMPADVSYYNWPEYVLDLIPTAEKIVIPHHSGQVYGLLNVPQNTNPSRKVYISSFGTQFTDLPPKHSTNYHRSFVDIMLNDTTNSRHLYTDDIHNASMPYYMIVI